MRAEMFGAGSSVAMSAMYDLTTMTDWLEHRLNVL